MTTEDDAAALAATRIAAVRARFAAGLRDRTDALAALAHEAAGADVGRAQLAADALRLGLHNLAGSAPTLGFVDLGTKAGEIERRMLDARLPDGRLNVRNAEALASDISALANEPA